jgi:hypothetical protein
MPIELVVPEGATTARLRDAGRSDQRNPDIQSQRVRWYLAFDVPSGPGRVEPFTIAEVGDLTQDGLSSEAEAAIGVFESLLEAAGTAPQRVDTPDGDPAVAIWNLTAMG